MVIWEHRRRYSVPSFTAGAKSIRSLPTPYNNTTWQAWEDRYQGFGPGTAAFPYNTATLHCYPLELLGRASLSAPRQTLLCSRIGVVAMLGLLELLRC